MTKTESLEQTTTTDALRKAMGDLFGAERRLRGRENQQSRELTSSQVRALAILGKANAVTAGELAKSADLNPGTVTVMLDQLEAWGIVQRDRMARDRRVCVVSLTDQGRALLEERQARWQAMWEERFGDLSEAERSAALTVMRMMIDLLEDL